VRESFDTGGSLEKVASCNPTVIMSHDNDLLQLRHLIHRH
jgi:hypothetical protein